MRSVVTDNNRPDSKLSDAMTEREACVYCGLPTGRMRSVARHQGPRGTGGSAEASPSQGTGGGSSEASPSRGAGQRDSALVSSSGANAAYCCYGCRVAHAIVQERGNVGAVRWTVVRLGLAIFFTMNLMAFTMTMWSLDVYDVEPDPFQQKLYEVFRWLSMLLGLPVLLLLGIPLLRSSVESWKQRVFSTDLLIATGVTAAYVTSVANVVRNAGTVYFEVGAMVLVMVTLGRWFEAIGKQKATEALDQLAGLLPERVIRVTGDGETDIASAEILIGDELRVRAGERFATDAVIVRGWTSIDEQVFTGESLPVSRGAGDRVLAGTVNLDGDVTIRATAAFRAGSFGRLLNVLQQARQARGHYQQLADRVAAWFFPVVAIVAIVAFTVHLSNGIGQAIQTSLAVLLIACPCALGLATPLAVWTALSTAVRHQVLFRSGEAIERLAAAKVVCFDKTGTLTTGSPRVTQMTLLGGEQDASVVRIAHELAAASTHPFSKAVAAYLEFHDPAVAVSGDSSVPGELRTVPGGGVECVTADGGVTRLGSMEFVCCEFHAPEPSGVRTAKPLCILQGSDASGVPAASAQFDEVSTTAGAGTTADCVATAGPRAMAHGDNTPAADRFCAHCSNKLPLGLRMQMDRLRMAADQQAASVVMVSRDQIPVAAFLLTETIRHEAPATIQQLAEQGFPVHVLTGDRAAKAHHLRECLFAARNQADVRSSIEVDVRCNLRPEDKVTAVGEIRRQCGTAVMVGDGINDAPALAASDVGIAMGCGADVSRDSAQVCLLTNDLTRIPWAIELARRTRSVIRQNLFWAFGYNGLGIVVAASGMLNPAIAAALMIASSLLVISNSLRLMRNHAAQPHDVPQDGTPLPSRPRHGESERQSDGIEVPSYQQMRRTQMAEPAGVIS